MSSGFADMLSAPSEGTPADSPAALVRPQSVIEVVATFVRTLHTSPVPTPQELGSVGVERVDVITALKAARARVEAGLIDRQHFDEAYRAQGAHDMLASAQTYHDLLMARAPVPDVRVHGELSLHSLLIDDGAIVGWPQVPVRIGDAYCDIAPLARSAIAAMGPGAIMALFEQLQIIEPDPIRLEFWVCMSQLR